MTPADEGIAAAKADDSEAARLTLAEMNARKIKRRAASILTDVKQYRDPALLDPSDLDEIGRGLERLRKIAGEAIDAREAEEEPDPWIDMPGAAEGMRLTEKGLADVRSLNEQQTQETDGPMERLGRLEQAVKGVGERLEQIDESAKPEPFPTEGAATGGFVGRYYRERRRPTGHPYPKPDLDLLDNGDGHKALGFEMRLPGLDVEVVIKNSCGQLPDEGKNLAAFYIDGDERARILGDFEETTRWARVMKRELEELEARDQLRFVSWSKFSRAFDGVLR